MTRPDPSELAAVGAPILYAPDEAAAILDPSGKTTAYWLLRRARSGQFPCTQVGRSKVFSPANLAEIARLLNKPSRPKPPAPSAPSRGRGNSAKGRLAAPPAASSSVKPPRRKRGAA
jgi:hypothetical protein